MGHSSLTTCLLLLVIHLAIFPQYFEEKFIFLGIIYFIHISNILLYDWEKCHIFLNALHLWLFHFYNLFHVFVFCWNIAIYWLSNAQSFVCGICWPLFCVFLFPCIFWLWAHVQWTYFLVHENPMSESTEQFCVGSREYLWMSKVLCYFPVILLIWVTGTKYGQWFKFHNLE